MTRLLGFAADEVVGRSLLELVSPEDRARVAEAWTGASSGGADVELTTRLCAADNLHRTVELRCVRAAAGELLVAARESHEDSVLRAELAALRRTLSAMFECCQDYVLITDQNITVTHSNRTAEGLTESTVGKPMLSFAAPEDLEAMTQRVEEVMREGKVLSYEVRAMYPDGSLWDYSSRLGPIRDGDRNVGVVLITRDVTAERAAEAAKRHAEQQVREYTVQLERSNRELERFASIASHDLQEPLRKIQAFSDRLREKFRVELPEAGRDYIERIRDAAKRMQDLINDLLMFSRLSAKETYTRVNLMKVARSVMSDLEVRIEETGGAVKLGELPTIEADAVHMRQLLQNLIGNALKFSRQDVPPRVEVSAEIIPASGRAGGDPAMCRLKVSDNGIGIEQKYFDRIFGIFERLHGRGKYEGTGVGLAVCHKIAEQHHGRVEVHSVVGEGTTFTILLPVKQPDKTQQR